jgi:hypothetical protein
MDLVNKHVNLQGYRSQQAVYNMSDSNLIQSVVLINQDSIFNTDNTIHVVVGYSNITSGTHLGEWEHLFIKFVLSIPF